MQLYIIYDTVNVFNANYTEAYVADLVTRCVNRTTFYHNNNRKDPISLITKCENTIKYSISKCFVLVRICFFYYDYWNFPRIKVENGILTYIMLCYYNKYRLYLVWISSTKTEKSLIIRYKLRWKLPYTFC